MTFDYILNSSRAINTYFLNDFNGEDINIDEINLCRTHAFKIQAFGRVTKRFIKKSELKKNKNSSEKKVLIYQLGESLKNNGKFIEDSIGGYLYHYEMKEASVNGSELKAAREIFLKEINTYNEKINEINTAYNKLLKISKNNIRKIYLKGLKRELKKVQEDLKLIDSNLLEDGTHELRRKLRWVIMYIIYPEGLFGYIEENPAVSKYTKLKPNKSLNPVLIPFEIMNFLSESVYGLGKLKDKGLFKNYNKSHSDINKSSKEIIDFTTECINEALHKKYLKSLREVLKENL